jgi:hypothetical protein
MEPDRHSLEEEGTLQGKPVIFGSLSYFCAMLEILAHASIGGIPATHRFVVERVPDNITVSTAAIAIRSIVRQAHGFASSGHIAKLFCQIQQAHFVFEILTLLSSMRFTSFRFDKNSILPSHH